MTETWTNKAPTEPGWYWLLSPFNQLNAALFRIPYRNTRTLRRQLDNGETGDAPESYARDGYLFLPVSPPELPPNE